MAMIGQTRFVDRGKTELFNTMVISKKRIRVGGLIGVDAIDVENESQDWIDGLAHLTEAMRDTALDLSPAPELPAPRGKRTANGLTLPDGMISCPRCHGCFNARQTCDRCDGEGVVPEER